MKRLLAISLLMLSMAAGAVDNVLLIQLRAGGGFTVWHTEGESRLSDEEAMELEATATPTGGAELQTGVGPARAYETPDGVTIHLPAARNDRTLLVDRDDCNHIRIWHSAGATSLSDDQIADIFISALPGGGKRLSVGPYYVKGFITKQGVTATLWNATAKK